MCGIAGLIHLDGAPVSPVLLQSMTDAIAHRGPDGEGHWIDGPVGLGHRRLAIIDLSPGGAQPKQSADGRHVLTYNGELYNYRELRLELQALGRRFTTESDSEVMLQALAEWGTAALGRFNGMFAFALWDRETRQLLLARDRYGIKPLYTCQRDNSLSFGSEQKAILADPQITRHLDRAGLAEYFTFQNFFTDHTLIEGVRLFPAGHYGILDLGKAQPELKLHRYWDFDFREPDVKEDPQAWREELDRLFQQAVNRQLVTDVELGSYLSGGMDSGSITAIAARSYPYMKTFTCGFDLNSASGLELAFDERAKAEFMSYHFKTEHYEMVLKAGDMERVMERLTWHLEEPRVGQSYPNFYAAQLASRFVKVVLSGTGGDELFGGYPWRYYNAVVNRDFDDYVQSYGRFWQRLIPPEHMARVMSPIAGDTAQVDTAAILAGVYRDGAADARSPQDYVNQSLNFEARTFLHGLLLVEDKLSMAHGLESRVPFLDNDLVDFAMRCPVDLKLNRLGEVTEQLRTAPDSHTQGHFEKTNDGKQILRDVMQNLLPGDVSKAEKQGFSAPDASWFKGDSIDFVRRELFDDRAPIYAFLDYEAVSGLMEEHMRGEQNRRLFIWSLLNVNTAIREFGLS